jgi:hypothetical protein
MAQVPMGSGVLARVKLACAAAALASFVPLLAQSPAQTQSTPPVQPTAAISGVVVDASTGRPLAGAVVSLAGVGRGGIAVPRTLSDADGRFVFSRLPPGEAYAVAAARRGYLQGRYGQPAPGVSSYKRIALVDGQWYRDANVTLWRANAISGTVVDETNEPVVDALVRAVSIVMIAGRPQFASGTTARTDDRGRYRIGTLSPGRYVVMLPSVQSTVPAGTSLLDLNGISAERVASSEANGVALEVRDDPTVALDPSTRLVLGTYPTPPPDDRRLTYATTFHPSARTTADAAVLTLAPGEERQGIDIRLTPLPAVRITGTLQGIADAPSAGMTVRLMPEGSEGLGFGSETATALVGADGRFSLANVPAGRYTFIASRSVMEYTVLGGTPYSVPSPPGFASYRSGSGVVSSAAPAANYSFDASRGSAAASARMPIVVGDRDLSGVVVPLRRAVTIRGRYAWDTGSPPAGAPRMGMPVYAEPANGDPVLGMPTGDTSPAEPTRFVVEGLLPGEYILRAITLGGGVVKSIVWEGRDYTTQPFDASIGRDIDDVVITLTTKAVRLSGTVRTSQGAATDAAAVIAFPADPHQWTNYGFRPARIVSGLASSRGTFTLPSLPAGEYFLIAVGDSQLSAWQDPKFLEAAAPLATRVTLDWGDTKAIDLTLRTIK